MTDTPEGTASQPESNAPREGNSGALPFGANVPRETHETGSDVPPATPSPVAVPIPIPVPPPSSTPTQPPIAEVPAPPIAPQTPPVAVPVPPPPRVEEVEAVRITRAETRGPAIEVTGTARTPEPPPPPAPPPGTFGASATPPPASPPPPNTSSSTPPPPSPPPIAPSDAAAAASKKFWVALCHLAYLIPGYVPGLVVTIVIWVWRRRRDSFLDDQAREAINFQLLYACLGLILTGTCVLCIFAPVLWVIGAVLCVVATVSAADGKRYRYPWLFRLIT